MTMTTTAAVHGPVEELRELRPHLAAALDRLDRDEAGPHRHTLTRLLHVLETFPATSQDAWRAAVLANMFGVVARGGAEDYEETALLFRAGGRSIAEIQSRFDELVRLAPTRPFATGMILGLSRDEHVREVLLRAGHPEAQATLIAGECTEVAFWLLMAGVAATRPTPLPRTPSQLRTIVERRGVGAWRGLLANIALNPFGPAAGRLADLAHDAGLPVVARAVEACARVSRSRVEDAERLDVAAEIRELVALSGQSQRRFATQVGTSPSRMSTYVNGVVTPSATMMLRIRRCSATLATLAAGDAGR